MEDLEEVEEIGLGLVLDLGQGLVPEDEDLGPDLTQEDALSLDQTQEIAPSLSRDRDLPRTQQETDLDPGLHPGLKTMIELEAVPQKRMETVPHPERERLQDLVHALGPVPVLDLEPIKTSKLDRT